MSEAALRRHAGACHCGAVRFEIEAPAAVTVLECNCSICARTGYLHLIVPAARFHLLAGEEALRDYRFGTGRARHRFCGICGIKAFYVPRSHPDAFSVNLRCVDRDGFDAVTIAPFDGRNWEAAHAAGQHRAGDGRTRASE
ncbi:MAG: GFA family protein [Myxococcales bacterium]|nr:GFA family protein [Myxococcales bacterium]MCB9703740.1 GFA family protein [Myxococcales bacterium]